MGGNAAVWDDKASAYAKFYGDKGSGSAAAYPSTINRNTAFSLDDKHLHAKADGH